MSCFDASGVSCTSLCEFTILSSAPRRASREDRLSSDAKASGALSTHSSRDSPANAFGAASLFAISSLSAAVAESVCNGGVSGGGGDRNAAAVQRGSCPHSHGPPGDEPPKKKKKKKDEKKKSKAPRHANIAAVNLAKMQAITTLREWWICHSRQCRAAAGVKSEFCYIKGDTHIALSHVLFDNQLMDLQLAKGPDGSYCTTTEMPPNNKDFCKILGNDNTGTSQSASVLCHQALQKEVPAPISAPPVTFQLGSFPPYPGVGPQSVTADPSMPGSLIPPTHIPGITLGISKFAIQFGLLQQVREKLEQNGYLTTDAFEFTSTQDLKDLKLLLGKIAQVCSAVKQWSISS
ncbi:hypothetical protein EV714DRAFT_269176 [Schizophyllum commune]